MTFISRKTKLFETSKMVVRSRDSDRNRCLLAQIGWVGRHSSTDISAPRQLMIEPRLVGYAVDALQAAT
jgi:hypothetical protein